MSDNISVWGVDHGSEISKASFGGAAEGVGRAIGRAKRSGARVKRGWQGGMMDKKPGKGATMGQRVGAGAARNRGALMFGSAGAAGAGAGAYGVHEVRKANPRYPDPSEETAWGRPNSFNSRGQNAKVGAGVGALLGTSVGALTRNSVGMAGGAAVGAGVGAGVGSAVHHKNTPGAKQARSAYKTRLKEMNAGVVRTNRARALKSDGKITGKQKRAIYRDDFRTDSASAKKYRQANRAAYKNAK